MEYLGFSIITALVIISSIVAFPNNDGYLEQPWSIEDIENHKNIMDSLNGRVCPPFGKKVKFEVVTIQTKSPMYGCAYMAKRTQQSTVPLFHLWLERPEPKNVHGHCKNMTNMDHFTFECLENIKPPNIDEVKPGWQYISLLQHNNEENVKSNTKPRSHRCAMFDMRDIDDMMLRIIRIVISKPMTAGGAFNGTLCKGLSELLDRDMLPSIHEGSRYWPDGSMYLNLLGRKAKTFYTSSTTTTSRPYE